MASSTQKAPKVVSVEVVATRPTAADTEMITALAAEANASLREVAYIVKIKLREIPEATGLGWALYAGDVRIPKYWEYPGGIYFKVLDPQFLAEHRGKPLRFSQNGQEFIDTGVKLPGPGAPAGSKRAGLPGLLRQDDVLKSDDAPKAQARATRAKSSGRKRKTKRR